MRSIAMFAMFLAKTQIIDHHCSYQRYYIMYTEAEILLLIKTNISDSSQPMKDSCRPKHVRFSKKAALMMVIMLATDGVCVCVFIGLLALCEHQWHISTIGTVAHFNFCRPINNGLHLCV